MCEENIDNCDPDPCHHGQCQDGIDSYTCICNPGYMGAICSDQVDECLSSPCLNEGRCIDLVNGYQCNCQPGTSGEPVCVFPGVLAAAQAVCMGVPACPGKCFRPCKTAVSEKHSKAPPETSQRRRLQPGRR